MKPRGDYREIETRTARLKSCYGIHAFIQRAYSQGANVCGVCVTPTWGASDVEVCEAFTIVYQSIDEITVQPNW